MSAVGSSRHLRPPHDFCRKRGIAEVGGQPSIEEAHARDPQWTRAILILRRSEPRSVDDRRLKHGPKLIARHAPDLTLNVRHVDGDHLLGGIAERRLVASFAWSRGPAMRRLSERSVSTMESIAASSRIGSWWVSASCSTFASLATANAYSIVLWAPADLDGWPMPPRPACQEGVGRPHRWQASNLQTGRLRRSKQSTSRTVFCG